MAKILLKNVNKYALIDDSDAELVSQYNWSMDKIGKLEYARKTTKNNRIMLHQLIMGNYPKGQEVDHINGNGLDNRRSNLRWVTRQQNNWNRRKIKGCSSIYKGVVWHKNDKKWQAQIVKNYKSYFLGYFEKEIDAAKQYDLWAKKLFGEFAKLNFKEL